MTLARRIVNAIAAMYAYAMAPDDYTPESRRVVIDEGAEAMEAAKAIAWLEEWMMANPRANVKLVTWREQDGTIEFGVMLPRPGMQGKGSGIVEALSDSIPPANH